MSWSRPKFEALVERIATDIESKLPGADARLRRSNLKVLGVVNAAVAHGLYGFLEYIYKEAFPHTAVDTFPQHASTWKVPQLLAAKATGAVTMTGNYDQVVPAGTLIQRSDGAQFSVITNTALVLGTANVIVEAVAAGQAGNTLAGSVMLFVTPIAGINASCVVTVNNIGSGADTEGLESWRKRLLKRIQRPPQAGSDSDWENWSLEVAGVTRVWVRPLYSGANTVQIFFVRDNDLSYIPDAGEIAVLTAHLQTLRPVTAILTVAAPTDTPVAMTIALTPDNADVRAAVIASLKDVFLREAEPGGTILISHLREAISTAAGESNHVLSVPAADVTASAAQIRSLGSITWV